MNHRTDVVTRIAVNPIKPLHLDVGGVFRVFRHTVSPYDRDFKEAGGGASFNARYALTSGTRLLIQSGFGSGLGRYIGGLTPDVAFRRDGSIHAIATMSWVSGVEQQISPRLSVSGYYSGVDADSAFDVDSDGSFIGFGFPGASTSNNRSIREITATGAYQFLRSPDRGSGLFSLQTSWLRREPWSAENELASAKAFLLFAQVRYNLP